MSSSKHITPGYFKSCIKETSFSIVDEISRSLLGTSLPEDVPLMTAGLDSLGATELASALSSQLSIEIEPTALFDHPTI